MSNNCVARHLSEAAYAGPMEVSVEPCENLKTYLQYPESLLRWDCLFMLPPWITTWRSFFGEDREIHLFVVKGSGVTVGLVPLMIEGDRAFFVADSDLIDYGDVVVTPSREKDFFSALFDHLRREKIRYLDTGRVRGDSKTACFLSTHAEAHGYALISKAEDVLYEMELPETWEAYLALLSPKERHELRRKMRRLESSGRTSMRVVEDETDVGPVMETFIRLFRSTAGEKRRFMTERMEAFFRQLAIETASAGMLRLFSLELDNSPVAIVMCFEHDATVYLYNNGYDHRFKSLSAGLLSKVFSIRESIAAGRKRYNFLKGSETYKRRLGGRPVTLTRYEVILK